jgi:predicted P-loop ATPase
MSAIEYSLRNYDYRSEKDAQVAIDNRALEKKFHPIKDYLTSLIREGKYDGKTLTGVDYIGKLAGYFEDKDGVFPVLLRKWLIGAVARVLGSRPGQQHPMLVLDGQQGIGKSRFTWWLGSPLPAFYIQSSINTSDKDFLILLCSKFVWEVEELGATLRKSDIESLKAFLSKEIINVRKPYGRDEIIKPATASFIGTINNSGGFLADPTGSRRFRVCTLTKIDWSYERAIDVNQIWAQAVALYEEGETSDLGPEENKRMAEINSRYDVDDPLFYDLVDTFNIEPLDMENFTATAEIIHRLRTDNKIVGGNDNQIAQRIANVLTKMGCEKSAKRINGQQVKAWRGVWTRL